MILNGSNKLTKRETTALEDSWLSFEGGLKGYLLQNVDEILQTRGGGQGLKLYDKLYDDPHVQAVMNKLASAVTSKDWIVAPGGEKRIDQKAADLVRSQLANLNAFDLSPKEENHSSVNGFDQLTRAMIVSGRLNGYVCAEAMWANRDDMTAASEIRVRDPRQFGFMRGEYGYVLRHLTRENSWTGETPPLKKILVWSYGALDGSPYGRALGKAIFWPVFFKKSITRFDLKFLERFASPKPTGKYPRGATPQQIAELRAALSAIADETEIAIPEGMLIEYLEAASSGTMDAYERSLRYWDEQISEAVLGETGSTNQSGSGGSRARDQVGNEVRIEISKAIADSLSSTFNRLARWITEFNFPGAMPPTVYRDFEQGEEITSRSGVDKILFDLGYRLTPERVADTYGDGYEQAGGDDKEPALISSLGVGGVQALTGLLTQAATGQLPKENAIAVLVSVFGIAEEAAAKMVPDAPEQKPQTNPLDQLFGGQGNGTGQQPPDPNAVPQFAESEPKDAAELIADKARPLVQDAIAPWLDQVRNFVEQATSLEEIRDGLIDLYPDLDDAAFAEAMGQAMLLGDLAGREEVLQDDTAFAEAIEAALNGTLDFAAPMFGKGSRSGGKKPNCTAGKSHFCQTANGRGSCVPMSKKCKFKPSGAEKAAADWVGEKIVKFPDGKNTISPAKRLGKTGDPLEDALNRAMRGADLAKKKAKKARAELKERQDRIDKLAKDALDKLNDLELTEAIEAAVNGTLDFAAKSSGGKKPNCTAGKSHFCQTANGRGSCVPMSKKCKFKPTGAVKAAADWEAEKVAQTNKLKAKPKAEPKASRKFDFNQKGDFIGKGMFGEARIVKGPPPAVIKVGNIQDKEIDNLKKLSDSGVTPKYIASAKNKVAMEIADGYTAEAILKNKLSGKSDLDYVYANTINTTAESLFALHVRGFAHNDLHDGNIVVDLKNRKAKFVDLAWTRESPIDVIQEAFRFASSYERHLNNVRKLERGGKLKQKTNPMPAAERYYLAANKIIEQLKKDKIPYERITEEIARTHLSTLLSNQDHPKTKIKGAVSDYVPERLRR